jgi:hypothetical protein
LDDERLLSLKGAAARSGLSTGTDPEAVDVASSSL